MKTTYLSFLIPTEKIILLNSKHSFELLLVLQVLYTAEQNFRMFV